MSEWQPIETAPKDGTIIQVRYADKVEGGARWLTQEVGQHGSKERQRRADLILRLGGYWANAKITRPSRSRPTHWKPVSQGDQP